MRGGNEGEGWMEARHQPSLQQVAPTGAAPRRPAMCTLISFLTPTKMIYLAVMPFRWARGQRFCRRGRQPAG